MLIRKYIIFGIFLLFWNLSCGQDIITADGNIPIILSAPHGGSNETLKIKNRESGVTSKDSYTIELLQEISKEIQLILKKRPSIVYSNRSRKEIDFNRSVDSAFVDKGVEKLYYQYHFDIQNQIMYNIWSDSVILYVDIHGQAHKHELLEIGFDKRVFTENEMLLGNMYISKGIKCYPSTDTKEPTPYFDGGHSIETYKSYPNVVAVQLEVPAKYRKISKSRKEFAKKTALILVEYYKVLQKEKSENE